MRTRACEKRESGKQPLPGHAILLQDIEDKPSIFSDM